MTRDLVTLRETDTLGAAETYLELGHIRHLPVISGKKLVGLITHRDLLRHCGRPGSERAATLIARDAMTREVRSVNPWTSARDAIAVMLSNKFGCLPVTDQAGTLVGIITESDLLRVADSLTAERDLREEAAQYGP